jgi:predicted Zn-dependent peptidase
MRIFKSHVRKAVAGLLALTLCSLPALAQTAPAAAGQKRQSTVIKGRAPVNKETLKVNLPKAQEATLKNGLRVILLESHRVPTFAMQMVILSGGLSDPADHHGLANFTASLLREGTTTRKSKDIAEQLETLGATLSTSAGLASFTSTVTTSGLVENLDPALDIFADVVRNPAFPQDEVEKYKTRLLQQLKQQRANPNFLAAERFNSAVYGSHPAALLSPSADAIKRTTPADLSRFHSQFYKPNNAMVAVVGDVTMKELLPKLERAFGNWEAGNAPKTEIPQVSAQKPGSNIYLIDRPGSVQTVLQLGNLGINRTDPDYFALLVTNKILGGDAAARLFLNLREDKGYTYGAYSFFGGSKFRGIWAANSSVRTDVTEGAMREFMNELKRIRDEKVPMDELENAKRAIVGSFALSLEDPQSLLQNLVLLKLYDLPADYWDTYPQKVSAITAEDVQRAAQNYVSLQNLQIVAVGDAAKAREVLAKYGTVEVYNADGQPVTEKKPTP